jgi:hypothetical protein
MLTIRLTEGCGWRVWGGGVNVESLGCLHYQQRYAISIKIEIKKEATNFDSLFFP